MSSTRPSSAPGTSGKSSPESLKEVIARRRKTQMSAGTKIEEVDAVPDPYKNAEESLKLARGATGVTYDLESLKHKCLWDADYPENPERLRSLLEGLKDLFGKCEILNDEEVQDIRSKVLLKHTEQHYTKLEQVCKSANLETESAQYDAIYFNESTFTAACESVRTTIKLVNAVAQGKVMNGMAFSRPPGHHAMGNEYNGYCFFNNVAIAAENCIKNKLAKKIMIIDVDVHHGQGTQRMFYDREDIMYFSIHRYEQGTFWPNLPESNFNYIGKGKGLGRNVNVPLNATGLVDNDYLAIVFNILLPLGYEFNPDLIIVSMGYDAAVGCPEGKMNVTPGFYAHLITLLQGLARGKIAVVLEGGYFLPSLVSGARLTLQALLGYPCPLLPPVENVHPTVIQVIRNVRRSLLHKWKCFDVCELLKPGDPDDTYEIQYWGTIAKGPYETRNCYPQNSNDEKRYFDLIVRTLQTKYDGLSRRKVGYIHDKEMLLHAPPEGDMERPEKPERLEAIQQRFKKLEERLLHCVMKEHNIEQYSLHKPEYLSSIGENIPPEARDLYVNQHTRKSAFVAANAVLSVVDSVMENSTGAAAAAVRPPGHHADFDEPGGFCFLNNVAIAANYLQEEYKMEKILIVDFDIHHGNGTQNLFYASDNVMYISIHKDDKKFFPENSAKSHEHDGYGLGRGYNINIGFSKDRMGDTEYLAAFHHIVLPAAYSFAPQVVLISAGFDAGIEDPLGNYKVHPETFAHLVMLLKPLAEGRLILVLEGGYNLITTSYGMTLCTKALMGDPIVMPKDLYKSFSQEAIKSLRNVSEHFKKYYKIFEVNKKLPNVPVLVKRVTNFKERMHKEEMTKILDADRIDDNAYVETEMRVFNGEEL